MILEEIRLKDFRCFYGESIIKLSTDSEKNITIIYAENGVGKTTILNALLWCFYGTTTARFELKEDIVNHSAKKLRRTRATVEIRFEHRGGKYRAARFIEDGQSVKNSKFIVARLKDGKQNIIDPPDTFIHSVIPEEMAPHFLFDGEHAEVFLAEKNRSNIKGAIRDILGCSLVEQAIADLNTVSNQFKKKIAATISNERSARLEEKRVSLNKGIEKLKLEKEKYENARIVTEEQIEDIEKKLRDTAATRELQAQRQGLETEKAGTGKKIYQSQ